MPTYPPNRPSGSRPGGVNRPMPSGSRPGSMSRPGGGGVRRPGEIPGGNGRPGLNSRRDVTDEGVKAEYFKQSNFDQTKKDYKMTKMTFGVLAFIIVAGAASFFFNLGTKAYIAVGVIFIFWLAYFVNSLRVMHKFKNMPLRDRGNYWTYELSQEYTDVNVKLNDFKKQLASSSLTDNSTLLDDVSVELVSLDPLIFDFSIRSASATEQRVKDEVSKWVAKFEAKEADVERLPRDNISYRVIYTMKGQWEILDGKTVDPSMALTERQQEAGINWNPFGLRTTTMEEVAVVNTDQHVMITGMSGYGKSATLNAIVKNLMEDPNDVLIVFFDAKFVEAAAIADRVWTVTTEAQALAWCDAIEVDLTRRQRYQQSIGKKKFATSDKVAKDTDAAPFSNEFPPIVVVVDECAIWLSSERKFANRFTEFLNTVAKIGRSNGVTLIVAAQEANSTTIPSGARSSISQRIAFRLSTGPESEHAIGQYQKNEPQPINIPAKTVSGGGGVGQCCARTATTNNEVWPVKTYYVSGEELKKTAKQTAYKRKPYKIVQYALKRYQEEYGKGLSEPFQ